MIKIYLPNISKSQIGGGWTFIRNLKNGLKREVEFVDNVDDCHVYFITGPTIVNPPEAHEARRKSKAIVFRVDNVPRKSRNKRSTPHERMKEFADLATVVIYQSEWAKKYCHLLCGDGEIIYNGVDTKIFHPNKDLRPKDKTIFLYAYHGKNELKQFWKAHYIFQMKYRENPKSEFWFINDFGRNWQEINDSNFDFWNGEKYVELDKVDNPDDMAALMQKASFLIYPSILDACPNLVLEARASGLAVIGESSREFSGTEELLDYQLDITLERMCEEYLSLFKLITDL